MSDERGRKHLARASDLPSDHVDGDDDDMMAVDEKREEVAEIKLVDEDGNDDAARRETIVRRRETVDRRQSISFVHAHKEKEDECFGRSCLMVNAVIMSTRMLDQFRVLYKNSTCFWNKWHSRTDGVRR